ncbi:hypothetical protein QOZ80_6BG0504900 [Eleusine coracana subsp. coracana]|nr:hypothetical protein QOZ80_6BG0504900 [Eleusine coracana subsp. coracana]
MEMDARGGTSTAELELPGFRFHPTEEELLEFYLKQVAHGKKLKFDIIPTVQLYRHEPWELPGMARIGEREWYFFVPRDHHRKQQQSGGGRPSRTTERGFWKATGSDRAVRCAGDPKRLIGLKKTLVYYEGRAPRGTKTDWVMNEYRLPTDNSLSSLTSKEDIVLCKIYRKAVSLKELEQRVAMEELARAAATPSNSHNSTGSADSISSSEPQQQQVTMEMKKEEEEASAVLRPSTLSLPQLEVSKPSSQEWILQDPFLTQLRSPWMENWSPYYASVLNF